jgi:hypothetical protein
MSAIGAKQPLGCSSRMSALAGKADIQFQFVMHAAVAANARVPVAAIWLLAGPTQPKVAEAAMCQLLALARSRAPALHKTGVWIGVSAEYKN